MPKIRSMRTYTSISACKEKGDPEMKYFHTLKKNPADSQQGHRDI
jgi:hypothetical protein